MDEWVEIAVFKECDQILAGMKKRKLTDMAEDVALDPSKVIRMLCTEKGLSLQVDSDFFDYCRGC